MCSGKGGGGDYDCLVFDLFDLYTGQDIYEAARQLTAIAGRGRVGALVDAERETGLNFNPSGVLWDRSLRDVIDPIAMSMHDWMHIYIVNGIATWDVYTFLERLKVKTGVGYPLIRQYMRAWTWPSWCDANAAQVFSDHRAGSSSLGDNFKAGASEMLAMYPVLRHLIVSIIAPLNSMSDEIDSILKLFVVLDLLSTIDHKPVTPEDLHAAIVEHLDSLKACYDDTHWKPKHHFAMHLAGFLRVHGFLLSCFVQERRHKIIKHMAENVPNTKVFEESLLVDLVNHHVATMCERGVALEPQLVNAKRIIDEELVGSCGMERHIALCVGPSFVRTSTGSIFLSRVFVQRSCQIPRFQPTCSGASMVGTRFIMQCFSSCSFFRHAQLQSLESTGSHKLSRFYSCHMSSMSPNM